MEVRTTFRIIAKLLTTFPFSDSKWSVLLLHGHTPINEVKLDFFEAKWVLNTWPLLINFGYPIFNLSNFQIFHPFTRDLIWGVQIFSNWSKWDTILHRQKLRPVSNHLNILILVFNLWKWQESIRFFQTSSFKWNFIEIKIKWKKVKSIKSTQYYALWFMCMVNKRLLMNVTRKHIIVLSN